jgi:tRNA-dihydrouridine synthase A
MLTTAALKHGHPDQLLKYHPAEKPLAIQLAGCEPLEFMKCAQIVEAYGFDEINLNVGCPSNRVQKGRFGACLMAEPQLVSDCVAAISESVSIPVTVKTRIGIDHQDSYENLFHFIETVATGGCRIFIIHARKAWLKGLSPKENREIPALRYDIVERLKQDFPALEIIINGGIINLNQAEQHLKRFDGIMIGRAVYHNPYLLAEADRRFYGDDHPISSRHEIIQALLPYVTDELAQGVRLHTMTHHWLGLFHGMPGGRTFRRFLCESTHPLNEGPQCLLNAARFCPSL